MQQELQSHEEQEDTLSIYLKNVIEIRTENNTEGTRHIWPFKGRASLRLGKHTIFFVNEMINLVNVKKDEDEK